jgi:hypothetical protein
MRRVTIGLIAAAAVVIAVATAATAGSAAGNSKLVEGTVYDTTCATSCLPECPPPPHCGPIPHSRAAIVCAQRRIVACPLAGSSAPEVSPPICLPESGCVSYPVYSGEGATVKVRRRGSAEVIATLPVVEGHFEIRLGAGEYVLHPYLPEEPCWSGIAATVTVSRQARGPVPATVDVSNGCVAHPDS